MIHGKSIFSQCMDLINRENFDKNARRRLADKGSKGFSSWDLLVSMVYLQLAQAKSLRKIEYGLKGYVGKLKHWVMAEKPPTAVPTQSQTIAGGMPPMPSAMNTDTEVAKLTKKYAAKSSASKKNKASLGN